MIGKKKGTNPKSKVNKCLLFNKTNNINDNNNGSNQNKRKTKHSKSNSLNFHNIVNNKYLIKNDLYTHNNNNSNNNNCIDTSLQYSNNSKRGSLNPSNFIIHNKNNHKSMKTNVNKNIKTFKTIANNPSLIDQLTQMTLSNLDSIDKRSTSSNNVMQNVYNNNIILLSDINLSPRKRVRKSNNNTIINNNEKKKYCDSKDHLCSIHDYSINNESSNCSIHDNSQYINCCRIKSPITNKKIIDNNISTNDYRRLTSIANSTNNIRKNNIAFNANNSIKQLHLLNSFDNNKKKNSSSSKSIITHNSKQEIKDKDSKEFNSNYSDNSNKSIDYTSKLSNFNNNYHSLVNVIRNNNKVNTEQDIAKKINSNTYTRKSTEVYDSNNKTTSKYYKKYFNNSNNSSNRNCNRNSSNSSLSNLSKSIINSNSLSNSLGKNISLSNSKSITISSSESKSKHTKYKVIKKLNKASNTNNKENNKVSVTDTNNHDINTKNSHKNTNKPSMTFNSSKVIKKIGLNNNTESDKAGITNNNKVNCNSHKKINEFKAISNNYNNSNNNYTNYTNFNSNNSSFKKNCNDLLNSNYLSNKALRKFENYGVNNIAIANKINNVNKEKKSNLHFNQATGSSYFITNNKTETQKNCNFNVMRRLSNNNSNNKISSFHKNLLDIEIHSKNDNTMNNDHNEHNDSFSKNRYTINNNFKGVSNYSSSKNVINTIKKGVYLNVYNNSSNNNDNCNSNNSINNNNPFKLFDIQETSKYDNTKYNSNSNVTKNHTLVKTINTSQPKCNDIIINKVTDFSFCGENFKQEEKAPQKEITKRNSSNNIININETSNINNNIITSIIHSKIKQTPDITKQREFRYNENNTNNNNKEDTNIINTNEINKINDINNNSNILDQSFQLTIRERTSVNNFKDLSKHFTQHLYKRISKLPKKQYIQPQHKITLPGEIISDIKQRKKKLLVIDLVDTLCRVRNEVYNDSVVEEVISELESNLYFNIVTSNNNNYHNSDTSSIQIQLRPNLFDFLNKIKQFYYIIVFTSSSKKYAEPILDFIESKINFFCYRLFQSHCTKVNILDESIFIKDLRVIDGVEEIINSVVCVDDYVMNFAFDLDNIVPIVNFSNNNNCYDVNDDEELIYCGELLEELFYVNDVRDEIRKRKKGCYGDKISEFALLADSLKIK